MPTKQTKTQTAPSFDDLWRKHQEQEMNTPSIHKSSDVQTTPKLNVASKQKTRSKLAGVQTSPEMARKFNQMDLSEPDDITNDQARRNVGTDVGFQEEPKTPGTELAIISKEIRAAGQVEPEWHEVKNLPGYMASGIRKIGRAVFAPFTNTPIENIQVLANLGGHGPNDVREINAVAGYLRSHGRKDTEAELFFQDKIPDYNAEIKIYTAKGRTFMLVKDFAGNYIYSWPSKDEKRISKMEGKITFSEFLLFEVKMK